MESTFFADMADDYKKLYETKEDYDTIILSGKEPNFKKIYAHSLVLRTRSAYFRGAFSSDWAEKTKEGYFVLKKPNINSLVFEIILKFLYCGVIDLESQKDETILELLVATDELAILKLMEHIQEFLINHCYDFLKQDSVKMLRVVTLHEAFSELRKVTLSTICENPNLLFDSNKFFSLEEDVLALVIKRDDLNMDECDIWEKIVKWGIAQHTNFKSDVTKFSNEDFETLRNTLHKLLKIVRFYHIDKEKFISKVWPFRSLLPDSLIEDILRCHLVSNAVPLYNTLPVRGNFKIDSVLIDRKIAELFVKWINHNKSQVQYNFNLLFRRSRDGTLSKTFHQKCDNKGATIVVGKISNTNQLVGGYNPIDWKGNGQYKNTTESFLFKLDDLNTLNNVKLGRINQNSSSNAVYCDNNYGPTFGGGFDLYVQNNANSWSYTVDSYPNINLPGSIAISDYEVFQLVKKS